jgi:hypothetical protein
VKTAISERLSDLVQVAEALRVLVDAERPDRLLPGLLLARAAVDIDKAAGKLARHLSALQAASAK